MDCLDEVLESTYKDCFDDYIGPWFIIARLGRVCAIDEPDVRRATTMVLIERLLQRPDIGVGQFDDGKTFTFWNLSIEE
jgi:hypothetical protein